MGPSVRSPPAELWVNVSFKLEALKIWSNDCTMLFSFMYRPTYFWNRKLGVHHINGFISYLVYITNVDHALHLSTFHAVLFRHWKKCQTNIFLLLYNRGCCYTSSIWVQHYVSKSSKCPIHILKVVKKHIKVFLKVQWGDPSDI